MTRSRFKAPQNFLRGAGQALGLDLEGFFAEDEEGNQQFEGFEPGFRTSGITKGRGGVLAYKTPKTPTTMTEFTLTPQAQAAFTAPPTTTAAKKAYDFFSAGNLGGPGFGAQDLAAAKAAGFSDEDVKTYLNKNQQFFGTGRLSVAQDLIDSLKLNQSLNNPDVERDVRAGLYDTGPGKRGLIRMADPTKFAQNANTGTSAQNANTGKFANDLQTQEFRTYQKQAETRGLNPDYGISEKFFGHADLEAARQEGSSDLEIKSYLDRNPSLLRLQNVKGGGGLYDQLVAKINTPTASQPTATDTQSTNNEPVKEISTKYGQDPNFFGNDDLIEARKQGFLDSQIKDFLDKNQSLLREQNVPGRGGVYDQLKV